MILWIPQAFSSTPVLSDLQIVASINAFKVTPPNKLFCSSDLLFMFLLSRQYFLSCLITLVIWKSCLIFFSLITSFYLFLPHIFFFPLFRSLIHLSCQLNVYFHFKDNNCFPQPSHSTLLSSQSSSQALHIFIWLPLSQICVPLFPLVNLRLNGLSKAISVWAPLLIPDFLHTIWWVFLILHFVQWDLSSQFQWVLFSLWNFESFSPAFLGFFSFISNFWHLYIL